MTSTVKEIYNSLSDGMSVTVRCDSFKEYETIRTALCKQHSLMVALDIGTDSVCGTFNEAEKTGVFRIGQAKKKVAKTWSVISAIPNEPDAGTDKA